MIWFRVRRSFDGVGIWIFGFGAAVLGSDGYLGSCFVVFSGVRVLVFDDGGGDDG